MTEKYGKSHLKYCILGMSNIKAMAYSFSKRGNVSQVKRNTFEKKSDTGSHATQPGLECAM